MDNISLEFRIEANQLNLLNRYYKTISGDQMKNLLSNKIDQYSDLMGSTKKDKFSFGLILSREWNLDTFFKTIYMKEIETFLECNKYHEFSDEFKSFCYKMNRGQFRILLDVTPSDVAIVLKQIRIQSGYSLEQLAHLTGFSKSSISHRESLTSLTFPNLKTIQKYLTSCNMTFLQFVFLIVLKAMIR